VSSGYALFRPHPNPSPKERGLKRQVLTRHGEVLSSGEDLGEANNAFKYLMHPFAYSGLTFSLIFIPSAKLTIKGYFCTSY
jgi:hypothetical protein